MPTPSSSSIPSVNANAGFLTVPSTQNTAPVIKFRCLYTYDIRRKAKRWQDGFLRYHTFNKRIMVYDLTGNFIGDHHWRQAEGIQDGDELELDKGVLVQVCEGVEKTQTDLSALFEKKSPSQSYSPQSNGFLTQANRTTTTPMRPSMSSSSQIPRSLNDLLGIKRAPIGRAVTPKSPYEKRHPSVSAGNDGHNSQKATKRQKASPAEEILHANSPNMANHGPPTSLEMSGSSTHTTSKKTSDMNPVSRALAGSRTYTNTSETASKAPALSSITTSTIPDDTRPKDAQRPKDSSVRNTVHSSSRPDPITHLPEGPRNTLRLSTAKPRKKLMYSALLPGQGQDQGQGQGQGSSSSSSRTTATTANSKVNHHDNNKSVGSHKTNSDIRILSDNTDTTPRPPRPETSKSKSFDVSLFDYDDEPLDNPVLEDIFTDLQREPPPVPFGNKPSLPITTSIVRSAGGEKQGHTISSTDHIDSTTASSRQLQLPPTTSRKTTTTSANKIDTTNNRLTNHVRLNNDNDKKDDDENDDFVIPEKRKFKSGPPPPSRSRPRPQSFGTVNDDDDDNNSTTRPNNIVPSAQKKSLQKSLLNSLSDLPFWDPRDCGSLHPQPSASNSNFNDAAACTTAATLATTGETDKTKEKGPWTLEALDLFDFWPPGRQKPC